MKVKKYITQGFLDRVDNLIFFPQAIKENCTYLEKASESIINRKRKGFYLPNGKYATRQDDYFIKDGKIYYKAYIRFISWSDVEFSKYMNFDSDEEAKEVFDDITKKMNLIDYKR